MKQREINEGRNGTIWVPDTIAEWDAPSHWERERLESMYDWLEPGMSLVDVGTEHCWLTAVYGQFCGPENVVLCEPGPEMWQDIRLTWEHNEFPDPLGIWPGFVGAEVTVVAPSVSDGWPAWTGPGLPESPKVPYRNLPEHSGEIPTITIDDISAQVGPINAITVDVEGAEAEVLKGAQRVLKVDRPLVWLSVHPDLLDRDFGTSVEELFALIEPLGYRRQYLGTDHEQHHLFTPKRVWR